MKSEIKVSLILIVNKEEVYQDFINSLKTQIDVQYQLIPIANCHHEYDSARKAFNEASQQAEGDYIAFLHPDIRFLSPKSLCDIIQSVESLNDFGVAGVAGAKAISKKERKILSNIVHGDQKQSAGKRITEPVSVQTLDECFFIIKKDYFEKHPFPNIAGWHLYSVQYCLDAIRDGKTNYVVPAELWHLSDGKSLDPNYVDQLNDLIKKEKPYFDLICTTVRAWPTKGLSAIMFRKYYKAKQRIKKFIG